MLCAYKKKYGTEHVPIKLIVSSKFTQNANNIQALYYWILQNCLKLCAVWTFNSPKDVYDLSTNACEFMSSYLNDRNKCVKISNVKWLWMLL